jgi:microcin C transport system substrate-binding protein
MNRTLFFGFNTRTSSYFQGTELASSGLPQGQELEILETVRSQVPAEVFTTEFKNPVGGNPQNVRNNLREAMKLLKEAGHEVKNRKLVGKDGAPFAIEMLTQDPSFERVLLFFKPSLERLGITVTIRTVDAAQYENRLRNWDFDMIVASWPQSLSPGNEQREFWSSQAANRAGSRNLVGIADPAIDKLIERVIFATDRDDLVAATKALDRVLLWHHFVVPQWTYGKVRTARWDRFSRPEIMPKYGMSAFPDIWWFDKAKADKIGRRS